MLINGKIGDKLNIKRNESDNTEKIKQVRRVVTCSSDVGTGNMLELSWTKGEEYGQETIHSRTDYQHAS